MGRFLLSIVIVISFVSSCTLQINETSAAQRQSTENTPIAVISTQDPENVRSKIESALQGKTRVPIRWPDLPDKTDTENPLYVTVVSINRSTYSLELAWTPDCTGGNNCHYGTVRGSFTRLPEKEGLRRRVQLAHSIPGYFIDMTCTAYCDDSTVGWAEGRYHYSISIRAEKKEKLVKAANSAIAVAKQQ